MQAARHATDEDGLGAMRGQRRGKPLDELGHVGTEQRARPDQDDTAVPELLIRGLDRSCESPHVLDTDAV